ncbi:hypothetical protein CBER1_06244 [Cercospora berteroae]|uniref:Uncharacterized protein n=1 Tax=Cercospora berteroae TaxID=357750 RepID=A0A2S6CCR2_9PEZI|nr:hypothetical protein CBER1_06244 [Cercospora berteroae]
MDAPSLRDRIQNLPPELSDMILEYAAFGGIESFLEKTYGVVPFNSKYRLPWQLNLNRLNRRKASDLYYSQAIFEFQSMELLELWAKTLSQQQRDQLSELRVEAGWRTNWLVPGPDATSRAPLRSERELLQEYHRELQEIGARVPQNVLKTYWLIFRRRPRVVEQRIWMNERQLSERLET